MSKITKISISITPGQLEKIQKAIERGDYASTSEVIRTALRGWELREELQERERERLGRLWDEGLASGPARERSIDDIIAEAKGQEARDQAAE